MNRFSSTLIAVVVALIALGGAFFGGVYIGYSSRPAVLAVDDVVNKEFSKPEDVDFAPFWQAWQILNEKYVNGNSTSTADVKNQDKVWGAIAGMTAALGDPYTVFLPPAEKKQFEDDIAGNFSGVGMEIGVKDGVLTVVAPLVNSPAKRAGIKAGDKILEIDGLVTGEMSVDGAISKIRGPEGSVVRLTIVTPAREGEEDAGPREVAIKREIIEIPTIETELLGNNIFIIRLYNFSANSPELFGKALKEFSNAKTNRLILDLRGNPGGYLEAAVDMASWFLPKGKVIVWEHKGENDEDVAYRSRGYNIFNDNLKMVVLVDRGSASASEILAGALAEYDVATLVGETTFGKGSVQELVPVTSDTSLKVTIARWLTPKGVSISKAGLKPTVPIELDIEAFKKGKDNQLEKAIEILKK
ncbi:MAG: carboxyl-terminal processing protease [Patescibacteria group bacterium]|nr:carboxyl-terminal processing protease [Patescibacteria group bacterium]